jgi:hypothetical protein
MTWLITYASNIPAAPSRLHGGERKSCLCCRDIRSIADIATVFLNRRPLLAYKQSCIKNYVLRVSRRIVMRALSRRRLQIKNCRRWHFMILQNDAQITGSFGAEHICSTSTSCTSTHFSKPCRSIRSGTRIAKRTACHPCPACQGHILLKASSQAPASQEQNGICRVRRLTRRT